MSNKETNLGKIKTSFNIYNKVISDDFKIKQNDKDNKTQINLTFLN